MITNCQWHQKLLSAGTTEERAHHGRWYMATHLYCWDSDQIFRWLFFQLGSSEVPAGLRNTWQASDARLECGADIDSERQRKAWYRLNDVVVYENSVIVMKSDPL